MNALPSHGRIDCTKCYGGNRIEFGETVRTQEGWRITANPLAWGNPSAEVVVLGFSKGPTQAGALALATHDEIAYKGSRHNVGRILAHIGLLPSMEPGLYSKAIDSVIADRNGRFHFGSLVRCTVERFDKNDAAWKGSGGGMLDKFVASGFGKEVARNCTNRFLARFPDSTRLVVMFGLGTKLNYVREAQRLFESCRAGRWRWINEVAYADDQIVVVHVEHFASQGALIPNWLGTNNHYRSRFGRMAQRAVAEALEPQ